MARSHPLTKNRVTAFAARTRLRTLVLIFVALIVLWATIFAALERPSTSEAFLRDWVYFSAFLIGADELLNRGEPLSAWWIPILAGAVKIGLHAFLLGVVVFKLLVPQRVFVFRKRLLIRPDGAGGWELLVRMYNATAAELVDLSFEAFVRTPTLVDGRSTSPGTVPAHKSLRVVPFVRNRSVNLDPIKKDWPISIQHVPYSLPIPLKPGDVCCRGSELMLRSIQGHSITPMGLTEDKGEAFLATLIRGRIPSLGSELVETRWFQLSGDAIKREYEFGDFYDVLVQPGSKPRQAGGRSKSWPGWREFDDADPVFPPRGSRHVIFGYGSLVDIGRLSEFLHSEGLRLGAHQYSTLRGFRRAWSVAMDNRKDLPEYKYYVDERTGARPDVYVAFLNIEYVDDAPDRAPPPDVSGVLFEIDESALAILDKRERNYCRCDVSRYFPPFDGHVWAYLGSPEAEERFRIGLLDNSVVIDAAYKREVEAAFRNANIRYTADQDPRLREMHLRRIAT